MWEVLTQRITKNRNTTKGKSKKWTWEIEIIMKNRNTIKENEME